MTHSRSHAAIACIDLAAFSAADVYGDERKGRAKVRVYLGFFAFLAVLAPFWPFVFAAGLAPLAPF